MIKISNNDKELIVTKGAYENIYKKLGYNIVVEEKKVVKTATFNAEQPKSFTNNKKQK